MTMLVVEVDGPVIPTARVRVLGGRASTPRRTVEYQAKIALAVRAAVAASGWRQPERAGVHVVVYGPTPRGDADNVLKGCLDALVRAGALTDDSMRIVREVRLELEGRDDDRPGLRIEVTPC